MNPNNFGSNERGYRTGQAGFSPKFIGPKSPEFQVGGMYSFGSTWVY